jgi:hypothetical protein
MADRTRSTEPVSRTAIVGNVVALPGAAAHRVRQPHGGATVAYRKAHPGRDSGTSQLSPSILQRWHSRPPIARPRWRTLGGSSGGRGE